MCDSLNCAILVANANHLTSSFDLFGRNGTDIGSEGKPTLEERPHSVETDQRQAGQVGFLFSTE
jgi:uncharacterized protein YheU (UPF0270 family)